MSINPDEFGASFQKFMNSMATTTADKSVFQEKLQSHFQLESSQLATVTEDFEAHERPNIQVAIDQYLIASNRQSALLGISQNDFFAQGLGEMLTGTKAAGVPAPAEGPISYANVPIGDGKNMQCVKSGLYLISEDDNRLAILLGSGGNAMHRNPGAKLEIMASNRIVAEGALREIKSLMRKHNVYRGQLISVQAGLLGDVTLSFHAINKVERDSIILPSGLLERIEKSTISFGQNAEKLLKWKRHLRRGLLLYGPPGTGKTFTIMYLAGAMEGRTVLIISGRGIGSMGKACALARSLQPSMVVIEDVDLIAEHRSTETAKPTLPVLMELLNEMDGLSDDTDTIFILSTNRPEVLEPALATRPGRVDQAFELPMPDAPCRKRLFELYSEGLPLEEQDFSEFVSRTEGASPAFIKELMRMSASFAADEGADVVAQRNIDEALRELIMRSSKLTKAILGFQSTEKNAADAP